MRSEKVIQSLGANKHRFRPVITYKVQVIMIINLSICFRGLCELNQLGSSSIGKNKKKKMLS